MKLSDVRSASDTFSGKASEIVRSLALAGIAVIWVFKTDGQDGTINLPSKLWWGAFAIISAVGFDLLHYITGSLTWSIFHWYKEKRQKTKETTEFDAPNQINLGTVVCFWAKIVAIAIGYGLILCYLIQRIRSN
jgi:hypothetical protein